MMNAAVKSNNQYQLRIVHDEDAQSPRVMEDNLGKMMCWHNRYNLGDKHDFDEPTDFLRNLVNSSLPPKDIIAYVKDGSADGLRLEYDNSAREWELKSYWDFTKAWYTEYTAEAPLNMNDDYLSDAIVANMNTGDLAALAEKSCLVMPLYLYDHSVQSISTGSFVGRAQHAEWDSGQVGWVYASHEDIKKEYGDASPENIEKARNLLVGEVETYDKYIRGECYGFMLYENGKVSDSCWGFIGSFDEAKDAIRQYLPEEAAPLITDMEYGDDEQEADNEVDYEMEADE